MRWLKLWLRRLSPRTTEGYVGLCVAVFSTATQITLVALLKDDFSEFLLVVPGALASWLLAVVIVAVVDHRRYRGVRDDWQEVKVFHAPPGTTVFLGTGDVYPRGPTMVVAPNRIGTEEKGLMGERLLCLYFNDGVRRKPVQGEPVYWQGKWGELELAPVPVSFDPRHGSRQGVRFTGTSYMTGNPDSDKPSKGARGSS